MLDCGDSAELQKGVTKFNFSLSLTDGSEVETYVGYECSPGYLLDSEHHATGYNAHLDMVCIHGIDEEMPNWNGTYLPQCLLGKTSYNCNQH